MAKMGFEEKQRSDTTNHGQLTPKPSPERLFPLKLLEAVRKSGCLLANFARPILVPLPRRDPQVPPNRCRPYLTFTSSFSRYEQHFSKVLHRPSRPALGGPARLLWPPQPAATSSCRGRPPSPSRPGLPAGASGRGPSHYLPLG